MERAQQLLVAELCRAALLEIEMARCGLDVVGIQEGRTEIIEGAEYTMVVAGADPRGNYGTQLWVRRSLRAKVTGIPVSTPTLFVAWLRFETSGSELMCVVGHAPHHGRPREERDQLWTEATSKAATELEKRAEQEECVVLIDANAQLGSIATSFIGSKDVGEEDEIGAGLREFAESVGIHLENTYHSLGDVGAHFGI